MIAAKYTQGLGFEVGTAPVPTAGTDEILLKVEAAAICGTDTKIIAHGHRKLRDGQTIILGHEFVGRIAQLGAQVTGFTVGERVGVAPNIGCGRCEMCARGLGNMCPEYSAFGIDRDGAQTEYVVIPASAIAQGNLVRLSEHVPAVEACLAEPLSCAISGVRAAQVGLGNIVVVYGAGPMGLFNVMVAAVSGAARVVVVDINDARLALAKQVGATDVVNPKRENVKAWIKEQTGGRGVDSVIVAVPVRELQQEGLELLAPFGRLCLFAGLPKGDAGGGLVGLDTNAIHYKQLVVTGMTGGAARDYRDAVRMIETGRLKVSPLISDVFTMGDMAQAFVRAQSGQGLKIVIAAK